MINETTAYSKNLAMPIFSSSSSSFTSTNTINFMTSEQVSINILQTKNTQPLSKMLGPHCQHLSSKDLYQRQENELHNHCKHHLAPQHQIPMTFPTTFCEHKPTKMTWSVTKRSPMLRLDFMNQALRALLSMVRLEYQGSIKDGQQA